MFFRDLFFFLQHFDHTSLWKEKSLVWEPLHFLSTYLKSVQYKIEIDIPSHVYLENKHLISIGSGTILDPGVMIQGPCIIGKNCHVRHGAFLRRDCILGDGCVIGHGSEIKHSILLTSAVIAHLCYVGDSIIGSHVNLGAGVKCSNLRFDLKEILIRHGDEIIKTGLRKLGAIIGDGAQVGCNCVLNPGCLLGKKTAIHPLVNVSGYVPAGSLVKAASRFVVEPMAETILEKLLK